MGGQVEKIPERRKADPSHRSQSARAGSGWPVGRVVATAGTCCRYGWNEEEKVGNLRELYERTGEIVA